MKVVIEYDPSSGEIKDSSGMTVANWAGLEHFGEPREGTTVRDLIKLKEAGFSAEEIVQMKDGGVL